MVFQKQIYQTFLLSCCLFFCTQAKAITQKTSEEKLQKNIAAQPNHAPHYILLGQYYLHHQRINEAIKAFQTASKLSPFDDTVYIALGQCYQEQKNWEKAANVLERALEVNPGNAAIYFDLGIAYQGGRKFNAAKKIFEQALKIEPKFPAAQYNLALVHEDLKEHDKAEEIYRNLLKAQSEFTPAHLNLGKLLAQKDLVQEAQVHFEKSLASTETKADAYYNLALLMQDQQQNTKAIAYYQKVITLEPEHAQSHNNLGVLLSKAQRQEESLKAFINATTYKPDFAEAFYNLALVYIYKNQLPEASKALYALIEIDPGNQEIHLLLAQLLEQQNDVQGALAIYKKMDSSSSQTKEHRSTIAQLELETKNPKLAKALLSDGELPHDTLSTKILKAKNASKTGQWSTALGIYQDLYEEHPSNQALLVLYTQALAKAGKSPRAIELLKAVVKNDTPTLQLELGRLYLTSKRWDLSQKAYEKAAQHQRTKVDAYLGLADLAYALNDAPHEIQFLKQALQWDPQHLHALISLGKAQHAQGQYQQARQSYNKALNQAPNNEKIYYLLGFTWDRLDKKERALSAFKKALELKPDFKEAKSAIEKRQSP